MPDIDPTALVQALSAACTAKGYALRVAPADDAGARRLVVSDLRGHWLALIPPDWTVSAAGAVDLVAAVEAANAALPAARRLVLAPPMAALVPTVFD